MAIPRKWYNEAVFYHIYPLGLTGAPKQNPYGEVEHRLNTLLPWIAHLKSIGITALYIGPLFESVGHGYETTDYKKVDSRLGDNADLKNFVAECHKNGIPVVVVHLSSWKPMPEITENGIARFERLFAYAEEKGVIVALENQRFLENLSFFMDRYPSLGFCWDVGHEYGFTKGIRFMKFYGDRAVTTHVHDNRSGFDTDDHLIPFDGKIDYKTVVENLASSPYDGTLMLELTRHPKKESGVSYDKMSDKRFFRRAAVAAKKLMRMTIKKRKKLYKKEV